MLTLQETPLAGAFVIETKPVGDARGFFARAFCQDTFAKAGVNFSPVQANHAASAQRGTLRGLHYQAAPHAEMKLVRCIKGAVFDVMVDMREDSSTYLQWYGAELSAENKRMLLVPEGFAHGYLTLTDDSEMYYMASAYYAPAAELGLRWDDPAIGIDWPIVEGLTLSDKDKQWPLIERNG